MGRLHLEGASLTAERPPRLARTRRHPRRGFAEDLRRLYEGLSAVLPRDRIFFLNFGCAEPGGGSAAWLAKTDRADKHHYNLVRRVLAGVKLCGCTVLEIGSGRGGNCRYLARYTDAWRVIGLDLDEGNVQFCRRVHRDRSLSFLRGQAEHLPLPDASVDVVLSIASAHGCENFSRFLAEAGRVLKPRGLFCLADTWGFEPLGLDWAARQTALDRSGFRRLREEDLSESVFQALQKKDGLTCRLRALATPATRDFLSRVADSMETVGLHLAAAQCSYKLWRLEKP